VPIDTSIPLATRIASATLNGNRAYGIEVMCQALDALDTSGLDEEATQEKLLALTNALAAAVPVPAGAVLFGESPEVWANPLRPGWSWRCGCCRMTGNQYRTGFGGRREAQQHADEHGVEVVAT
jgi:hypothetical protein